MLTAVKLPPSTARLLVGSLCLCACAVPLFVGDDTDTTSNGTNGPGASTTSATTVVAESSSESGGEEPTTSTTNDDSTSAELETTSSGSSSTGEPVDPPPQCLLPPEACDAAGDDLGRALGVGCGSFVTVGAVEVVGPPESRAVTPGLGAGPTFAPRLGSHTVVLSTGVAAEVALSIDSVMQQSDCSQLGLPCPSTDFPDEFDLALLPAPLAPEPAVCLEGQMSPGGDCSGTIDEQWLGDPRLAHDYTELRFSAEVPGGTIAVALSLAMFTAERPKRFPGGYNDFLIVWLDSERWTGNIAVHPVQGAPVATDVLDFPYTNGDVEIADFAFAEHAGTDWFTVSAPVLPGETVALVIALFDESDGSADTAVLLDDLRWECDPVALGGVDRP
jgi:hypothetical protein